MTHWYRSEDGQPLYTVPKADGKGERATTLRDARKLNLVPSVTTILGIVDKPALTRWKINEVLEAAIEQPYCELYCDASEHWKSTIIEMSEKKGKDAADRGTQIHNALEQFYTIGKIQDLELHKYCIPAIELISNRFSHMCNWRAEHSFSHKEGFGGKCDLYLEPCEDFPHGVIIDFKTKSTKDFSTIKAYDEHCMQLVAYREGFNLPKAECYNLFIGTNTPGDLLLHKWEEEDCKRSWKMFQYLLYYWKESNKFNV